MLENLRSNFKEDYIQRMFYGFLFCFWAVLNIMEGLQNITYETTDYVYYFWMFVIPDTFIFFQIISNSKIGWILVLSSFIAYISFSLYNYFDNLFGPQGHLYIAQDYILAVFFYSLLFAIVFFIWIAKPVPREQAK